MREKIKVPNWIKLDNAATIYPSTLSRKYASMFRLTITLSEKIDRVILNKALNNVIKRFPSFRYKLKQGLFWCYFKHIRGVPIIQNDVKNPMLRINFKENSGFMFRIRYFDKRIAIEYFHALTDGTGGITFLLTLTAEYLRIKYGINVEYSDKILNLKDKPSNDETMDSFKKYARKVGGLESEMAAYHYKGKVEESHILNIITGIISISELKGKCKEYNCTITQFIVSVMLLSLQEMQKRESKRKKKPIKILVPVNLRNIYSNRTLRNFSSYVNVGIETKYGDYSFEEIIKIVKNSMELMITEKRINAKISGNVKMAKNYFVRLMPMFIKKHILSISEHLMGDRYCSSTFSNLGNIELPKEMANYVKEMGFIIGKPRSNPGASACIGYNGKLYISFSRKIKESEFERLFFTNLVKMNIGIEIESNIGR